MHAIGFALSEFIFREKGERLRAAFGIISASANGSREMIVNLFFLLSAAFLPVPRHRRGTASLITTLPSIVMRDS